MDYCTATEVIDSVGENILAEMLDVVPATLADNSSVARAIHDASSLIDSYLHRGDYAVPVAVEVPALRRAAIDIAVYYIFSLRRMGDIEDLLARHREHVRWLKDVASGSAKIAELEAAGDDAAGEVVVVATASRLGLERY